MPHSSTLHASCVAFDRRGVLIIGASGSGKSGLALQLIALGAQLVADDRVIVTGTGPLTAQCPTTIKARIEARFVGILYAEPLDQTELCLAIDMDQRETARLPPRREVTINQYNIPLLYNVEHLHFPAAVAQMVRAGRSDPA